MHASTFPEAVTVMHAQRDHRIHHFLWHQIRNMWLMWDEVTRSRIIDLAPEWEPPRPALRLRPDGNPEPILNNGSGEDFLYMHRQMIVGTNLKLAEIADANYPEVVGWPSIPRPDDSEYPVPPTWNTGDLELDAFLQTVKSDEFFADRFIPNENALTSPAILSTLSLGELGAHIEFAIHNWMHLRWAAEISEVRPDTDPTNPDMINPRWDDPAYQWLGDTYSSHVNPIFWKIHGWCDDRINDWMAANGVVGDVPWQDTWVGKMPPHPQPHSLHSMLTQHLTHMDVHRTNDKHKSEIDEIVGIVLRTGKLWHFYDKVVLPDLN